MEENKDRKNIAQHILPTASNLLGLCFVLLSFIKLSNISAETIIDECLGILIALFLASCIFSYASMRSQKQSEKYEKIADIIFIIGLSSLALISIIIIFELI
ncbi:MAG: hypothetical protein PHX78_05590 [bacterium]|nr:hypothetical protein [bacterium]